MNPWRWFRARPRLQRTVIALLVMLPVMLLLVSDALAVWLFVALVTLLPLVIVPRVIAPVNGVDAYDPAHPAHRKASRLDLVLTFLVALITVGIYRLLT